VSESIPPLPPDVAELVSRAGNPRAPDDLPDAVLARIKSTVAMAPAAAALSGLGKWGVVSSIACAVGGAAIGLWAGAHWFRVQIVTPIPVIIERQVEVPVPAAGPAPEAASPRPVQKPPTAPPPATRPRDADLAQERGLLEMARTALSRGDLSHAFESLESHAAKFPGGQLVEERESLMIQALASSGRLDEAKLRAAEFRAKYPQSLLMPAVEAALQPE
jgi:hypothetical protein